MARQSLIGFTEYTFERYHTAAHHRIVAEQLERVDRGEIDRLMLLMPPRHGKSELASRRFPAFYLGRHGEKQIASVSASAELAYDFGREVRNLIQSEEYRALFDTRLAEDSQAKNKWHTDRGGIYYALGVGGQFMGRGADALLIDDPFSNMAEALSEVARKNVWDWYTGTAYNRLQPGGAIVVINHRMHEDDLSGRLLAQQAAGGDKWHVVELPAVNDAGEALWPEAYPIQTLERIRKNTFPRFWSALYQQRPAPEEGDYFRADWLKTYTVLPPRAEMRVYGGSDYAVTADGGDYTVHAVVGLDPEGRMYLLDLWRQQASSDVWVEAFCDLVRQWHPIAWAEETGQIRAGIGPFLDKRMRERQAFTAREQFPTRGDKAVRAQSIRGRMALQGLYVPTDKPWSEEFRRELLTFPAGKHDDQCVAENTLITMADGSCRPIESVTVGDMVATPIGPCEVVASGITNDAAAVYRVGTAEGRELVATGNHPVYVEGKGFVRVDALGIMDQLRLEPFSCVVDRPKPKSSNIADIGIAATRTARAARTNGTSQPLLHARDFFTGIFGRMRSGRSPLATTSITPTRIGTTTHSAISSASPSASIAIGIQWLPRGWIGNWSTLGQLGPRRLNGTQVPLVWRGIVRTVERLGKAATGFRNYVSAAVRHSMLPFSGHASALAPASSGFASAGRIWLARSSRGAADTSPMVRRSRVSAVIGSSLPSGQKSANIAPKPAGCVIAIEVLSEPTRVRNLTVSGAHVFYANGILTHNCDAMGLVGQLLDRMLRGAKTPVDVPFVVDTRLPTLNELVKASDRNRRIGAGRI